MRTAQILRQTDTLPNSILCLTFTESGATNMRQRLRQIIGEDAYKIAIHTFHSFGTEIINQHREYFSVAPTLSQLTNWRNIKLSLEYSRTWLAKSISAKNNGEFVYIKDLIRIISEFKQSGLTPSELRAILRTIKAQSPKSRQTFSKYFPPKYRKRRLKCLRR